MWSAVLRVAAWFAVAVAGGMAATPAQAQNNVLFIFDASGSMKVAAGPESRMTAAKKAMDQALKEVPAGVRLGLLMYGHRRANDCKDIELVSPIGADDAATINAKIQAADAKGETPIAEALRQAARSFAALKGQNNSIVLVTDGIEECKGDPCAAAREIKAAGLDLKAHVVGFTLNDQQRKAVQCIPDITGGKYFEAKDAGGLNRALGEVKQQTAAAPPQPPAKPNLLLQANGGQVLAAPNDNWLRTNDGKEDSIVWFVTGTEAVYGFKDERPATFDTFEVLIPGTHGSFLKDFELLVGDDSPVGAFRSIGKFTTQNVKLMQTPYQAFKFDPVTAKYLKVKLLLPHHGKEGNELQLHEFRLVGQLADATAAAPTPPPAAAPGRTNLLAQANGGQVVAAPNDLWLRTNDGKEDALVWFVTGTEAVYGFRDGRPATIDAFSVLVPGAHGSFLKDFELLVGDDSPVGTFRSIGKFTTQNVKLMQSPFQEFKFDPVTAKYLKVKLLLPHHGKEGNELQLHEFRAMGVLAQAGAAPAAAAAPATPGRINLLDAANGGQVLAAPNDNWLRTNDGKEDSIVWFVTGTEAVYGFKDERPATFDTFEVLIPGTHGSFLKDFELLVGDDSPVGAFRSIGKFTTQNVKLMQSPFQEFRFNPVTAKYLKVKLLLPHHGKEGNELQLHEFRLMGQLATAAATPPAAAPAATPPPAAGRTNLLLQANGGQVLAAPNDNWLRTNDGKEDSIVWFVTGTEAVYGFKDERPATFDTFEVLIPGTHGSFLKDFELLVGDDSPVGAFRSIGKFTTQNVKLMQTPYQAFKFDPVTAKYLKVKLLLPHHGKEGNELQLHEFRLTGSLK